MGKDDYIGFRVDPAERSKYYKEAARKNYRSISAFILAILRKYYKQIEKKTNQPDGA